MSLLIFFCDVITDVHGNVKIYTTKFDMRDLLVSVTVFLAQLILLMIALKELQNF